MSLIKSIRNQLGLSVTPANNFTLDASADNGTMRLYRGNAGTPIQDVMTIDAAGKATFPQGAAVSIQTWQNVTATREINNTPYTNNTSQPIQVIVTAIVTASGASGISLFATVAGAQVGIWSIPAPSTGYRVTAAFTVPAGATYQVNGSASTGTLAKENWSELR